MDSLRIAAWCGLGLAAAAADAAHGQEPAAVEPVVFYVALNGDDTWNGRRPLAGPEGGDGPFRTVARAQRAAREARTRAPVTVWIRGGTHVLDEPLVFGPEDSGTEERPVVYEAAWGERPVLSGGLKVTGWKSHPALVRGARADLAQVSAVVNRPFRQIWVDGRRAPRARLPSKGFFRSAAIPGLEAATPWHEGQKSLLPKPGDVPGLRVPKDCELVALHFWVESRMPVVSQDPEGTIILGRRSIFRLTDAHGGEPVRYYLENVREALDEEGEWCLINGHRTLLYLGQRFERMEDREVIVPRLEALVRFEGDPDAGRWVEHVTLRGLTFSHTEADCPPAGWPAADVAGPPQAAVTSPGAIRLRGARRCAIEECLIEHIGSYGIELGGGCRGNRVAGCEIRDLAGGGIKIGETVLRDSEAWRTDGNEIIDNHVHDGGLVHHSAVGIWVGHSGGNVIARNHVHDFYYTGLSVGWSWGYGPSGAAGNLIEGNHIHHVGQGWLSDLGAIYTLGVSPGTVIRNNHLHDVESHGYGGWGLYFDEGTTGIVAERNVIHRTKSSGFHQHYGRDNVVRNNIFALGRESQVARSRAEDHLSFIFERNIVWWTGGTLLSGTWEGSGFRFAKNIYWNPAAAPGADPFPPGWPGKGQDQDSIVADPRLADPSGGDFTLHQDSPARALGFEPIDLSRVGPRRPK